MNLWISPKLLSSLTQLLILIMNQTLYLLLAWQKEKSGTVLAAYGVNTILIHIL